MNFEITKSAEQEKWVWRQLTEHLSPYHNNIVEEFDVGYKNLGFSRQIPNIKKINEILTAASGWKLSVVQKKSLSDEDFFKLLAEKIWPVGNMMRSPSSLFHFPRADFFHDVFGHSPLLLCQKISDFYFEFGKSAFKKKYNVHYLQELKKFFFVTIEFGILKTNTKRRIFGAGIISSKTENENFHSGNRHQEVVDLNESNLAGHSIEAGLKNQIRLFEFPDYDYLFKMLSEIERKH